MKKYFILLLLCALTLGCTPHKRYIQINGYAQGGTYTVKLNLQGVKYSPEQVRDSIEAILENIDTTLSGYNKNSQLSRLNRGETIVPNALFREMYSLAYSWYERSDGALDFAAGPLYDAWGFGFKEGRLPSPDSVSAILSRCGMKHLVSAVPDGPVNMDMLIDGGSGDYDISLNFNAIAQGFSCDVVARWLYSIGVKDMLVDIGEIWCDGLNPSGKGWGVGIDTPYDRPTDGTDVKGEQLSGIWVSEGQPCGIVTSGNYRKYYVRDGRKYAHTVDPRSGYPVEHQLLSATVLSSSSSADADALATLCMVLGPDDARELILSLDGVEAYLISSGANDDMAEWTSPGFKLSE